MVSGPRKLYCLVFIVSDCRLRKLVFKFLFLFFILLEGLEKSRFVVIFILISVGWTSNIFLSSFWGIKIPCIFPCWWTFLRIIRPRNKVDLNNFAAESYPSIFDLSAATVGKLIELILISMKNLVTLNLVEMRVNGPIKILYKMWPYFSTMRGKIMVVICIEILRRFVKIRRI